MKHFFPLKQKNNLFIFCDDDVNHMVNVLRFQVNQKIICHFENNQYLCSINSINPFNAKIIEQILENNELKNIEISLFQSIIKPKHIEWILSKSTEIHLNNFYPILLERSQTNNIIKYERMNSIIQNASKQSRRMNLPLLKPQISFLEFINLISDFDLVIVPYEMESNFILGEVLNQQLNNVSKVAILVGPEGGFSQTEINKLKNYNNVKFVKLTKSILRSETASFYTLSVLVDFLLIKEKHYE